MSDSSQTRILIVDDDPGMRQTVAMLLASKGYEIATAEDGFDALSQMKKGFLKSSFPT
jgi:CheY-like chemotaxis protein